MAGELTISGQSTGDPAGTRTFGSFTVSGLEEVGETLELPLETGDNTIEVPQGAVAALILTPTTTGTLKLRSSLNAADAGLPLAPGQPLVYVFPTDSPPTSLIVNATASASPLTVAFI